jgi:hypothetical protein
VWWKQDSIYILKVPFSSAYLVNIQLETKYFLLYKCSVKENIFEIVAAHPKKLHETLRTQVKVKVKLSLCLTKHHAMKTYWESGGIAPYTLDLGTRWK